MAFKGQEIWGKIVNEYIELTENCSFNNAELTIFAKFLHCARTGNNKINEYTDEINMICLNFSPTTSEKCTNPYTLWLADTNNDVVKINNEKLQQLLTTNTTGYRIISSHSPVGALTSAPNELIKEKLYKIKHDKCCLPYIDLAIGARVMITKILHWEINYRKIIGIYRSVSDKFR